MKRRAQNRDGDHPAYADVSVCERWQTFENFLADMGEKPSRKYTLSRFGDIGNYKPGNVAWHTRLQQHDEARKKRMAARAVVVVEVGVKSDESEVYAA